MQQAVRHAPQQEPGYCGVATRPDDDDVGADLSRCVRNHLGCVRCGAADQLEARVDTFFLHLLDLSLDLRLDLVLVGLDGMTAGSPDEQLLAVNDDDSTITPGGQIPRVWQGTIRRLRPIGRPNDCPEHDTPPSR